MAKKLKKPKAKPKKLSKKLQKAAEKAAKKAKKKAKKAAEKAAKQAKKAAKKLAKKAAKASGKGAGSSKQKAKAKPAKKPAGKKAARKAATPHHRLPEGLRHVVEEDEERERVGDDEKAFVGTDTDMDEAKERGEEFVRSATSGEEAESEMEDEETEDEQGGPFIQTSASTEFGYGTDASNPKDAEVAAFPSVSPPVKPDLDD